MCAVTTQPRASQLSHPPPRSNLPPLPPLSLGPRAAVRWVPPPILRCRPSRAVWIGAGGIACFAYYQAAGGWPDLTSPDDQAKVGAPR